MAVRCPSFSMAPPTLLAGLLSLCAVLQCARAAPTKTVAVQYQLLSLNSGRLVAATSLGDVHAMGSIDNPRTLFYPHRNIVSGTVAFQSVCYPEWYLIFHNKTEVKLGVPHQGNELFEETLLYSGHAYKSYVYNDPHCYLAFDDVGNVHDQHLCQVTTQHRDVRIFPMEALQSSSCHRSTVEL